MFWIILALYFIGMPLIGYPVGKLSLKAWKYPEKFPQLRKILFPLNWCGDTVGKYQDNGDDGDNLPMTMTTKIHGAIGSGDPLPLAKYLVMQMFIWPLRLAYTVVVLCIIITFGAVLNFPAFAAKQLMRCKRCVEI